MVPHLTTALTGQLLDLERRNFLELLAMDKTQERIEYMLRHSKPLRN
jgi:3-hydroxyacyl-CoA dehydrogenase